LLFASTVSSKLKNSYSNKIEYQLKQKATKKSVICTNPISSWNTFYCYMITTTTVSKTILLQKLWFFLAEVNILNLF